MQYEITLPADYDMGVIRHRVATRGSRTDDFPGLGLKAYGVREKGVDGSPVNQYAPFYLWAQTAGMDAFLFGPAFAGIVADFGRPPVRTWTGVAFASGPAREHAPRAALRTTWHLSPDAGLQDAVEAAAGDLLDGAEAPGLHSAALVVDPTTWQAVQYALWVDAAPDGPGDRYQVLHTSSPRLGDLPRGRAW